MPRRALRDAEKIAKGGFKENRWSEAGRAETRIAKVHVFPTFREIPEPTHPMMPVGQAIYDKWARILFDAGHLTVVSKDWVELLAWAHQGMSDYAKQGRAPPASYLTQANRALGELKYLNADQSLTPNKPTENRFSKNGFAGRLQRT